MSDQERGPAIIAPPPLLYLVPLLAGRLLDRVVPLPNLPKVLRQLGYPTIAGGALTSGWFLRTMRRAQTPVDPRQAPTALVTDGPFRHTRNPGYVGVTLVYTGVSLRANGRWSLMFLPAVLAVVDRGVVRPEEQYLARKFGAEYSRYKRRVPRWF